MLKSMSSSPGGPLVAESQTSSPTLVVEPDARLLLQEVKASIQNQYLVAAENGQISKVKAWRIVRGLDQNSLAARANMTQPEVSRAERPGQVAKMKGDTLRRIAQALQVRIDDLF